MIGVQSLLALAVEWHEDEVADHVGAAEIAAAGVHGLEDAVRAAGRPAGSPSCRRWSAVSRGPATRYQGAAGWRLTGMDGRAYHVVGAALSARNTKSCRILDAFEEALLGAG